MRDKQDLIAFAKRDWALLARLKHDYWAEWHRTHTFAEALAVADDLRKQAIAQNPGWPTKQDRLEDLKMHLRVSEALRRVTIRRR